ncbi:MAG: YccF domain-containing protein [Gammaproteobacteria bacterium]|nr:YccF domain-containing protein [Gammaproteobacteria bacterium]
MRTIGNILWFIFGGFFMGLAWWFYAVLAFVSIVGIPWGRACFVLGKFAFWPFGREAINRRELTQRGDIGTSVFGTVGNVIWFILAGLWLAIGHVISAVFLAITIIGIPFAIQHIKLAGIALAPIGKTVVYSEVAQAARRANADERVASMRR